MTHAAENSLISQIRYRLEQHSPVNSIDQSARPAAVAIVLVPQASDLNVLFIRRAVYASDPWSGQVAFPGGRQESGDNDLLQTALRETHEEIGADLSDGLELLGRLDDFHSWTTTLPNIFVRPFVIAVEKAPHFTLSREVANAFWVPLSVLRDDANWKRTAVSARGTALDVIAFHCEGQVIWGMTERILSQFLSLTKPGQGKH